MFAILLVVTGVLFGMMCAELLLIAWMLFCDLIDY